MSSTVPVVVVMLLVPVAVTDVAPPVVLMPPEVVLLIEMSASINVPTFDAERIAVEEVPLNARPWRLLPEPSATPVPPTVGAVPLTEGRPMVFVGGEMPHEVGRSSLRPRLPGR